jgi:hypothetical protein
MTESAKSEKVAFGNLTQLVNDLKIKAAKAEECLA